MAIIKSFLTQQGVLANYHKIIKAEIKIASSEFEIWVAIYASAEARDSNCELLRMEYVSIPFSALSQDPRALLYPMLMTYVNSYVNGGVTDSAASNLPPTLSLKS